jgi:geranylgeranyl diphosphate synthase type I
MRSRIESMSSAVKADNLEAALEAAIRRFDGTSPVTPQVHAYFGYTGDAPGTRARSRMQLVLEVVAEEGGSIDDGIDVASAVEILHNSTLVHEAVEDPRRSRFGLAHGINAGDALSAMAYLHVLEGPPRRAPELTVEMTRALQAANFALCAGQAGELGFARGGEISPDAYLEMLRGQAALYAVACELGAFASGASCERAQAYGRLGRTLGVAYRMEDDVRADPATRHWRLPAIATHATVEQTIGEADALAGAAGIDRGGAVRAFFRRAIRHAA